MKLKMILIPGADETEDKRKGRPRKSVSKEDEKFERDVLDSPAAWEILREKFPNITKTLYERK